MKVQRNARRGGFTLLEVLLVLAILGVIAAIVVPNLLGRQKEAYVKTTRSSIDGLMSSLELYAQAHDGEFPDGGQEEMVEAMTRPKDTDGQPQAAYTDKFSDAWGEKLNYRYPPSKQAEGMDRPDIWSNGPNKKNEDGGGDDIGNWDDKAE